MGLCLRHATWRLQRRISPHGRWGDREHSDLLQKNPQDDHGATSSADRTRQSWEDRSDLGLSRPAAPAANPPAVWGKSRKSASSPVSPVQPGPSTHSPRSQPCCCCCGSVFRGQAPAGTMPVLPFPSTMTSRKSKSSSHRPSAPHANDERTNERKKQRPAGSASRHNHKRPHPWRKSTGS